jgi:guanylate kinase
MPRLFVLSAPSGGGKTTLCNRLLEDFPNITLSVSSTTRLPRGSEKDGVEYHFTTRKEFEKKIRQGQFAEWAEVHENFYGTSREVIDAAFAKGNSVLLDIDVQGADSLKKAYPKQCYRLFIAPPSIKELEFRLRARGTDNEDAIERRLRNAQDEMERAKDFDRIIINDSLERAYTELKTVVAAELERDLASGGSR